MDWKVVDFQEKFAAAFARLNQEWISTYFSFEEHDHHLLGDPKANILDRGGQILFVVGSDETDASPVGCCALLPRDRETIELGKTAVEPSVQGKGIGRLLVQSALQRAGELGFRRVYLETNTVLEPANRLYEKLGFRDIPADRVVLSDYARTNRYMELWLK